MSDYVCGECGAACAQSRSGRWVHVADIPGHTDPHDARPVSTEVWEEWHGGAVRRERLEAAKTYARDLRDRMARPEMAEVWWNDVAVHAVVLLDALERLEAAAAEAQGARMP